MYPKVIIDVKGIKENACKVIKKCHDNNISVTAVGKVVLEDENLVPVLLEAGADYIGDSRIDNLKKVEEYPVKKWLIRLPMECEISDVIKYSDCSLNSEIETIRLLNEEAQRQGKIHEVILMLDLGDLREGFFSDEELFECVKETISLKNIILKGIGVNLTCVGGVIPEVSTMERLVNYKEKIEEKFNISLEIVSGGNSSTYTLLEEGKELSGINNLRLGEVILFGRETSYQEYVKGLNKDTFILKAQIIELKEKPSVPIGKIGKDAFDNEPVFTDRGMIKKAIVAVGRQDVIVENMVCLNNGISIMGASSDHTVLDATDYKGDLNVGDIITFRLLYSAALHAMTSPYIHKEYIY